MSIAVEKRRLWIWGKAATKLERTTPELIHEFDSDVKQLVSGQSHILVLLGNSFQISFFRISTKTICRKWKPIRSRQQHHGSTRKRRPH